MIYLHRAPEGIIEFFFFVLFALLSIIAFITHLIIKDSYGEKFKHKSIYHKMFYVGKLYFWALGVVFIFSIILKVLL
ncbi:hypothetical protein [Aureivirga sp. CE67]|uniref:hypothetical protein n=1 Tax=Aureivirga sp. CE67 TaxID=1788983 RepID=UPI0018CB5DBF|nr:hypothetical protein [Aureivirga sp. CE67]